MFIFTHVISNLFFLSLLISSVIALPYFETRAGAASGCHKNLTGTLAANVNGKLKPFTLVDPLGSISYNEKEKNPLKIEFQLCDNLVNPETAHTEIPGRIYVPKYKQCIKISNQPDALDPYFTMLSPCDNSYGQRFLVRTKEKNSVYWAGDSDPEGTVLQGGCGLLRYKSKKDGTPILTENGIAITCKGTPFKIIRN